MDTVLKNSQSGSFAYVYGFRDIMEHYGFGEMIVDKLHHNLKFCLIGDADVIIGPIANDTIYDTLLYSH